MDYKIKFEYKGIGKQAAGIRSNVLQAQKKKGAGGGPSSERQTLSSLKDLNTSIQKLIASNKELITAMKRTGGGGGGNRPGGGGGGGGLGGFGSGGFGKIGASIPIAGAIVAGAGFALSKINQIGKAYIQRTSEQIGSTGIAGFRTNKGVYMGAQIGAGMKAYGTATGEFSSKQNTRWIKNKKGKWVADSSFAVQPEKSALDVGAIYGMSAEETLGTAGRFKRAGASYTKAVDTGLGMGIQTELPTLLTGMADILTEAVKNGINTSDMTKDMAKEISALTMRTAGKSVDAALKIIGGFKGAKEQVGGGKVGSFQGLITAQASQDLLMEKLTGKDSAKYRESLKNIATKEELDKLATLKPGATFSDLAALTPSLAHPLLRQHTLQTGEVNLQKKARENINTQFKGIEGKRVFKNMAAEQGFMGMTDIDIETWLSENKDIKGIMGTKITGENIQARGKGIRGMKTKEVTGGVAGTNIQRMQTLENLLFTYGSSFAQTTLTIEKGLLNAVNQIAPTLEKGMGEVNKALKDFAKGLSDTMAEISGNKPWFEIRPGSIADKARNLYNRISGN